MKKKEKIFIAGILLFALLLSGVVALYQKLSDPGTFIRITVDGEEYGTYSLSKDQVIPIGDTNVCEIRDGAARMVSALCPDQLCIHQGAIGAQGGLIVCLPNRIVIQGGGSASFEDNLQIDAVS